MEHYIIEGKRFADSRGKLNFFNAFNLTEIVRLYEIEPAETSIKRGWQAHKEEKKWFYCNSGAFKINLIKVDNFDAPSKALKPISIVLEANDPKILVVPGGYATAIKAETDGAKLLVFSNFDVPQSTADDYRYSIDHWLAQW